MGGMSEEGGILHRIAGWGGVTSHRSLGHMKKFGFYTNEKSLEVLSRKQHDIICFQKIFLTAE